MCSLYHHHVHGTPRAFVSDIGRGAEQQEAGQPVPSLGLSSVQIAAGLREVGLSSFQYTVEDLPEDHKVEEVVCRYLNSRIPVIVGTDPVGELAGHAMVLIGYGRGGDGKLFFVQHDDSEGPYLRVTDSTSWAALVVPVPGKIFVTGEQAEELGEFLFREVIGRSPNLSDLGRQLDAQPKRFRLRTYVTEAADYKRDLQGRGLPQDVWISQIVRSTSRFIWVVELQDVDAARRGRDCVIGELAIDATSDPWTAGALFGNLPTTMFTVKELGATPELEPSPQTLGRFYASGAALHAGA
jgi:hypothetical protein